MVVSLENEKTKSSPKSGNGFGQRERKGRMDFPLVCELGNGKVWCLQGGLWLWSGGARWLVVVCGGLRWWKKGCKMKRNWKQRKEIARN